ncbi:MAG: polyprenyl synthetase family protein [Candidatus Heimdallarchaeota archaeon]
MDILQTLSETVEAVQKELNKMFQIDGGKEEQLGSFGDIFYSEFDNYLTNAGKRIRPFLTRTAFEAVGGNHDEGNITKASLAIELLHSGSLLHDDVIDKDETRRGKPSFYVIFREMYKEKVNPNSVKAQDFGEAMSIFAGDLCFPFAIESIVTSGFPEDRKVKALHAFTNAFREVIDGVIIETGASVFDESTEEEYMRMIYLKTGALIRKAVEIGGILGDGSDKQISALVDYCDNLGKAFQIQDDVLGVFADPKVLGKPVGGDIREGKFTILRIIALKNGTPEQKERLNQLMGKEDLADDELIEVQKIYKDTGALDYAIKLIEQTSTNSITALEKADPALEPKAKELLILLSQFLAQRSK